MPGGVLGVGVQLPPRVTPLVVRAREKIIREPALNCWLGKACVPEGVTFKKRPGGVSRREHFRQQGQDVPRSGSRKEAGIFEALKYSDLTRGLHWSGGFREVRA